MLYYISLRLKVLAVASLELLATTAGAGIVAARELLSGEGGTGLLGTGVLCRGCLLCRIIEVGRGAAGIVRPAVVRRLRGAVLSAIAGCSAAATGGVAGALGSSGPCTALCLVGGALLGGIGAVLQKIFMPEMTEGWQFLTMGLLSFIGTIGGSLLTKPTDRDVLENFYKTTRPFGFWGPLS